jgi:hypothetical protein
MSMRVKTQKAFVGTGFYFWSHLGSQGNKNANFGFKVYFWGLEWSK